MGIEREKRAENAQKTVSETRRMGIEREKRAENAQKAALETRRMGIEREKALKKSKKWRQEQENWAKEQEKHRKHPKSGFWSKKIGYRGRKSIENTQKAVSGARNLDLQLKKSNKTPKMICLE